MRLVRVLIFPVCRRFTPSINSSQCYTVGPQPPPHRPTTPPTSTISSSSGPWHGTSLPLRAAHSPTLAFKTFVRRDVR